jgi:DNA invertase Pin-like site-specific DNA recombinase
LSASSQPAQLCRFIGAGSDATMERPAFQRLLSEVSAGKIDVVVEQLLAN